MQAKPSRSLRIKSFRGAPADLTLEFDPRRALTLIYGENGTGKTTICDAYDFVANRYVGSLADRGLGQLHPYWPTAGKAASEIVVELTIDGTTWTARAKARDITVTPTDVPPPRVELLRRSTLAKFVTGDAKDRYAALRPFIDLSKIEQAEQTLRDQIRSSQTRLDQAASNIGENQETLRRMMVDAGATLPDPLSWARQVVAAPVSDTSASTKLLRQAERQIDAAIDAVGELDAAANLATAANEQLTAARRDLEVAEQGAFTVDSSLVALLEAAQVHFTKHAVGSACPLCESPERAEGLADRVRERIAAADRIRTLASQVRQAEPQVQSKADTRSGALRKARQAIEGALTAVAEAPDGWRQAHAIAINSLEASKAAADDAVAIDVAALRVAAQDASTRRGTLESAAARHSGVKTALDQYDENVSRQAGLSQVLPRLKQVLEVCDKQRKQYLEHMLGAIAVEVGRLYEAVHPGEGLNKISFKLAPNRPGSLDLGAEFFGKPDLPPQAYFSDSHLDSLGLCIFLALAARQAPGSTIVVLDDVLGSIDEPHVDRLIGMLYEESLKFKHTILTTHYRPWREKFRWGWLQNSQCEFIELDEWTQTGGIAPTQNSLTPLAELRRHLAATPPSLQAACASAGVILERACDFLAERYEIDVPYKRTGLTLGDLLPRVAEKRLAAALRIEVQQPDGSYVNVAIGEQLIKLRDLAALRNIFGAHYNVLADMLPPQDAIAFAQAVSELMTALVCDDHGWPKSDKSGSYWATQGETRRLHPLKKPR